MGRRGRRRRDDVCAEQVEWPREKRHLHGRRTSRMEPVLAPGRRGEAKADGALVALSVRKHVTRTLRSVPHASLPVHAERERVSAGAGGGELKRSKMLRRMP